MLPRAARASCSAWATKFLANPLRGRPQPRHEALDCLGLGTAVLAKRMVRAASSRSPAMIGTEKLISSDYAPRRAG